MRFLPASSHQSRVHDNARKPGDKRRTALKRMQAGICFAQAFLQCVLGIFFVPQDGEGSPIEPSRVTREELLLGINAPGDGLLNDDPVIAHGGRSGTFVGIQLGRGT